MSNGEKFAVVGETGNQGGSAMGDLQETAELGCEVCHAIPADAPAPADEAVLYRPETLKSTLDRSFGVSNIVDHQPGMLSSGSLGVSFTGRNGSCAL